MIEISLECTTNTEFSGIRRFNKNLIYFGGDYACDLFTPGKDVQAIHGFIEIVNEKLLIHLGDGVDHIHLDGKKTTSVRYFKPNQIIKFNNYELAVCNFLENSYSHSRNVVNQLTDEIIKIGGKDLEILKSIQEYE